MTVISITIILMVTAIVAGTYLVATRPAEDAGSIMTIVLVVMCIIILLGLMVVDNKKKPYISPLDKALMRKPSLSVSFDSCKPPAPGLTDIVVFVMATQADNRPERTRCDKISKRFMVNR